MKLATLIIAGKPTLAVVSAEETAFWTVEQLSGRCFASMTELIAKYASVQGTLAPTGSGQALAGMRICAPLKPLRNVMCVGKNYHAHAREFTRSGFDSSAKNIDEAIPEAPIFFTKAPETVIEIGRAHV